MSVLVANSCRVTCDFCDLSELVEGNDAANVTLPNGWLDLTVPSARRLTFHDETCLLRFVRQLSVSRREGNAEMVGSVNFYLDRQEPEAQA